MSTLSRISCPGCGIDCIEQEIFCWQCGSLLRPRPGKHEDETEAPAVSESTGTAEALPGLLHRLLKRRPPAAPPRILSAEELISFEGEAAPETIPAPKPNPTPEPPPAVADSSALPAARTATLMTGEVVEAPVQAAAPESDPITGTPETVAPKTAEPSQPPLFVQTFCKNCGYQNVEGVLECARCKTLLDVLDAPVEEIQVLRRAWGFDVLGASWIILGFAAIYCGQFMLRADPAHPGATWADYFWTGVVVCAPGILIFFRHVFCKVLFWVMTFASVLIWAIICFIWIVIGLHVSDNGQIGLMWLAMLSGLSAISYFTVRTNDEFDVSL